MKRAEIQKGGLYFAKVAGRVTTVRVDTIRPVTRHRRGHYGDTRATGSVCYDVTNLKTGRTTTFRSAAKFRSVAPVPPYVGT